jgi:hypothetical protein
VQERRLKSPPGWWLTELQLMLALAAAGIGILAGVVVAIHLSQQGSLDRARFLGGCIAFGGLLVSFSLAWAAYVLKCLGDLVIGTQPEERR